MRSAPPSGLARTSRLPKLWAAEEGMGSVLMSKPELWLVSDRRIVQFDDPSVSPGVKHLMQECFKARRRNKKSACAACGSILKVRPRAFEVTIERIASNSRWITVKALCRNCGEEESEEA